MDVKDGARRGDGQRRVESSLQAELGGGWKAIEPAESLKRQQAANPIEEPATALIESYLRSL